MNNYTRERIDIYKQLEKEFDGTVIAFATGDRQGVETHIAPDQLDYFVEHLDPIGKTKRILLLIYTCGGSTLAAWNIINLLYEYCEELDLLVVNKCRSAGTLMSLGCNTIYMTKQATLGPIDPSTNGPLNPLINRNGIQESLPVSVESVNGYFDLLTKVVKAKDNESKKEAFIKLSNHVNPLVLGDIYRAKKQIKMLASTLIKKQNISSRKERKIINFLCSDSGSHDYTISRTEATQLGLKIKKPSTKQYDLLKKWYDNIVKDLELHERFDPISIIKFNGGQYNLKRAIIESQHIGSYAFYTIGCFSPIQLQGMPGQQINDNRTFDGWKKDE